MLKGKTVVITGGVRGIGKGIALLFAENGANLVICYRSNDEAAQELKSELEKIGSRAVFMKGDVADFAFAKESIAKAKEEFGSVDVLVNNAGITRDKLLLKMSSEDFSAVADTNLLGSFNFLKAASDVMIRQRFGRIINMSSVVGLKGNAGQVNYSASKAGIVGMTMSAAKELGKRGITVNAIAPGFVETEMTSELPEDYKKKIAENIALGRMAQPKDIANVALFLASDMASYVTGQVITTDGGMSI
ncbi:MAG: 3-oxoacyl-[acyl-carrier-protein] reductase [Clostridia bacterium]|nr:3-oxoacyl-[acyl-carrier-protein] reductase [Clostridia bacterium]